MGSALDRLLAEQKSGGGDPTTPPPTSSNLDRLLASAQQKPGTPSIGEQVKGAGEQVYNFFRHPIDSGEALLRGIAHSAADTFRPTIGQGEMPGSTRFGDEGAVERSRDNFRVTKENTPNAITSGEQVRGAINTAANLALPGVGGAIANRAVMGGLGAMNDTEQPVRGALTGLALGEVLHQAPKVMHVGDVSDGLMDAGAQGVKEAVQTEAPLWKPGRRPAETVPIAQRQPVEPGPSAEVVSVGNDEPMSALDKLLATRSYLAPRGRVPDVGEIARRPVPEITTAPTEANAPASTAETSTSPVSESSAPNLDALIANATKAERLTPREGETFTYPPELDAKGLSPVASANGDFVTRPGVMRMVNRDQPALPSALRLPPEPTAQDVASVLPEGVKRISPEEVAARGSTIATSADDAETQSPPAAPARGRKAPDLFDEARTPNGSLRPFNRVSDDGLLRELNDYQAKVVDAQQRSVYNYVPDENFHSTEDGRPVVTATRIGGKGVSQQAKALQNLSDYSRIMDEIEGELKKRGHTPDSIYERQQQLADLDASLERDAITHADASEEADQAFDIPQESAPITRGEAAIPAANALPSTPRNVGANDLLNRSTLDLDPTGHQALTEELSRLKEAGLDKHTVSFGAQRQAATDFADQLNIDRLRLDPQKYSRLSGAEIVGLKNVLSRNLNDMGSVSKQLADPGLSVADAEQLNAHLDGLRQQNDALLGKIVSETSQKGRDLGFLRQMSNATLDPDVWVVQAKRMAGDRVLSDTEVATIQGLAKAARDACAGGA